ncbi:MAG: hypothetical protein WC042_00580 [Candidatus Paceibacterota bacterium]|nr:hypothetical protein [Candidatus Paceibacterota bacterium]MDD4999234.1 hypothetical protein [Candidatus Paceibacterota bacterium]
MGLTSATYRLLDFRADVLKILKNYYGQSQITEGNKSIKIKANNGRLPADVIVCAQYRRYKTMSSYDYVEGMIFWTRNDNKQVINYPKIHYDNGVSKHKKCLLYNVPSSNFNTSHQDAFCNTVNWLKKASLDDFVCQNSQLKLFGGTPE